MRPQWFLWSFVVSSSCLGQITPLDPAKLEHGYGFAQTQLTTAVGQVATTAYPTITNTTTGRWNTGNTGDWRAGFFPGQLWQMYGKTGAAVWRTDAMRWTNGLTTAAITHDHDIGFVTMTTWGHALHLGPDRAYKNTARANILTNAQILADRFYAPMGLIDSWTNLEEPWGVAVDNMMNLELLFEARVQGGGQVLYDRAVEHANTTRSQHVRADGGTYHVVRHNDNGTISRKNTMQGYGDETTWSRGQAWAMHGYTTTFRYTRDPLFLDTAKLTADYFIDRLPHNLSSSTDPQNAQPGDWVPPSDFQAERGEPAGPWNDADNDGIPNETNSGNRPGTPAGTTPYVNDRLLALNTYTLRDSSAAAIAASGLLELASLVPNDTSANRALRDKYFGAGTNILNSLLTHHDANVKLNYLADGATTPGGSALASVLARGSELWNAPNRGLSYGDYYMLEALRRYEQVGLDFVPTSVGNQWTGATGAWSNASRWTQGAAPNGSGQAAHFRALATSAVTVTVDGAKTVGSITFNNVNKYTLTGSTIRLQDGAEANVRVDASPAAGHEIAAPIVIASDTTFTAGPGTALWLSGALSTDAAAPATTVVKRGPGALTVAGSQNWSTGSELRMQEGTLTLESDAGAAGRRLALIATGGQTVLQTSQRLASLTAGGSAAVTLSNSGGREIHVDSIAITDTAFVDLRDNDLIVDYAAGTSSPEVAVRNLVIQGRLRSLVTAANDTVLAVADAVEWGSRSFSGVTIDDTTVVGKYTYYGDANLDGKVTSDDYVAVDVGLGIGDSWVQGDFNFSGTVTSDDYVAIDVNLGKGTVMPLAYAELKSEMVALHTAMFGAEYIEKLAQAEANGFGATLVPEPGSIGAVMIGALASLRRLRLSGRSRAL